MITSFAEADREFQKIRDELAAFKKGDIDAKNRRIVNVAASQEPNDVVIREELNQFDFRITKATKPARSSEVGVFGLYVGSELVVANNVCPPHIVKSDGTLQVIYVSLKVAAIEGVVSFNLRLNDEYTPEPDSKKIITTVTLEQEQDTFPVAVFTADDLENPNKKFGFKTGDIITIDLVSVGGTYPGSSLIVKFTYA